MADLCNIVLYCAKEIDMVVFAIIVAIIIVILVWVVSLYNSMVRAKNKAEEAESGIDAHLNKRYDLIPNLVETVKGYAGHEKATLENVIKARNACIDAHGVGDRQKADDMLTGALKNLFALSESYPDLKANANFMDLQRQLDAVETEILNARKYYTAVARAFNDKIMVFPANILSGMFGFKKLEYVEVSDEARQSVRVSF